ncbi:MAG: PQQ-dependent sugar dehydrogenase [Acidimicrobiia bacterium]|nr:PQQ-dependent sugar dehydrogenase [Acidimicrobiia bacterium]
MRYLILVMALVLGACGDVDVAPTTDAAPQVSTTTTAAEPAPVTSEAPTSTTDAPAPTTSSTTTTTQPLRSLDEITLSAVEAGSGFTQPVLLLTAPGDDAWYVVDQPGIVWVVVDGEAQPFLDINDLVTFRGERGLLGMAFPPDFVDNGLVYLNYINNQGDTVVASVEASDRRADRETLTEVLRVDQPASNHNGGMIEFGPDGNLWIGLGDGGGADDQFGQGQRADTLLGAMVRIAVDVEGGYTIPEGNLEEEVWAIGLRNPWRFTFDGDDLWIADVGQNRIEEVDVVDWTVGNPNFGWSEMEGSECFGGECDPAPFVLPVYEYPHSEGCSITGGFAYRGSAIPELAGHYFFSDYCAGWLRSVTRDGEMREWLPPRSLSAVIGFGKDAAGELYVLTQAGSVLAITEAG